MLGAWLPPRLQGIKSRTLICPSPFVFWAAPGTHPRQDGCWVQADRQRSGRRAFNALGRGLLVGLDINRDAARLHLLGNFLLEVDDEQTVFELCPDDGHMIG